MVFVNVYLRNELIYKKKNMVRLMAYTAFKLTGFHSGKDNI